MAAPLVRGRHPRPCAAVPTPLYHPVHLYFTHLPDKQAHIPAKSLSTSSFNNSQLKA